MFHLELLFPNHCQGVTFFNYIIIIPASPLQDSLDLLETQTWKYFNQRAIDLKWPQIVHFIFSFLPLPVKKVSIAVNIQGLSILFGNICLLLTAWMLRSSIKSMAWLMEVIKRLLSARREFTNLIYCGKWKRLSISCQKETISACMPFCTDNELVTGTLSCWNSGWSKAGAGSCHIGLCQAAVARDEKWQWSKKHGENRDMAQPSRPCPSTGGAASTNQAQARQSRAGFQQRGENVRRSDWNPSGRDPRGTGKMLRASGCARISGTRWKMGMWRWESGCISMLVSLFCKHHLARYCTNRVGNIQQRVLQRTCDGDMLLPFQTRCRKTVWESHSNREEN